MIMRKGAAVVLATLALAACAAAQGTRGERGAKLGEENMVAVIPFTRGALTVVEGCLDVRKPRLPLPGGGFLVMKLARLSSTGR